MKDLFGIIEEEGRVLKSKWDSAKIEVKDLIEPKYFDFIESFETYGSVDIVNIIDVVETTPDHRQYPHCREFGTDDTRLYVKHKTSLETVECDSEYEGSDIEYCVWQTTGFSIDDYFGYMLLPLSNGRYWKVSYSC